MVFSVRKITSNDCESLSSVPEKDAVAVLDETLKKHFKAAIRVDNSLTRQMVSFQANKVKPTYRWYKYKEAFSSTLVKRFLSDLNVKTGKVLDPFSGAGTTLFKASEMGFNSVGIELLPIGYEITISKLIGYGPNKYNILNLLRKWKETKPWKCVTERIPFNVLRITQGAYSDETLNSIQKYLKCVSKEDDYIQIFLKFVLLCILESISFTRKDGQYLRWDYRSNRRKGKNEFNKGNILDFDTAILKKFSEIIEDVDDGFYKDDLFSNKNTNHSGSIDIIKGSCLNILPSLPNENFEAIITSPPYCNRYDYTRTYALELAMLGVDERQLVDLRQNMLSCTVENRAKELLSFSPEWKKAIGVCDNLQLLQAIIEQLEEKKKLKQLNNNGISRMVKGYFYEMACVIQECYRVLKTNGRFIMVNDNVRYAGTSISVDLILSKIAEELGFTVSQILVLPQHKGNSSQQMAQHGKEDLRKGVYIWEKH